MLGAAGALLCLLAGVAVGAGMKERRQARLKLLQAESEAVGGMRLLIQQEKPGLPQLLRLSAAYAATGYGADQVVRRLRFTADRLEKEPSIGMEKAYAAACTAVPVAFEKAEERAAMEMLFSQLGCGTAAMREEAASACLRRLKPLQENALAEAGKGGRLCVQLGMLLGAMAGILLW